MSLSKDIKKWAKTYTGNKVIDGGDIYIPTTNYPHVHITKDFSTLSASKKNHDYLAQGDEIYHARVTKALQDYPDIDIQATCTYISTL